MVEDQDNWITLKGGPYEGIRMRTPDIEYGLIVFLSRDGVEHHYDLTGKYRGRQWQKER